MPRVSRKKVDKYVENAVIIDGDMLPYTDERVMDAKQSLRTVEQGFVDKTMSDFVEQLDVKKDEISRKIMEYAENELKPKYDDNGNLVRTRNANCSQKNE